MTITSTEVWVRFLDKSEDIVESLVEHEPTMLNHGYKKISSTDHRVFHHYRKLAPTHEEAVNPFKRKFIKWNIKSIEEIDDIARLFEQGTPKPVFRGQSDYEWGLSTKLERNAPADAFSDHGLEIFEHRMLTEAFRRMHSYSVDLPRTEDIFSWAAFLQHHGAPTRLLDVSRSFYVACYFAVADSSAKKDAAVWIFNRSAIYSGFSDWQHFHSERIFRESPFEVFSDTYSEYYWPVPPDELPKRSEITYESLKLYPDSQFLDYNAVVNAALRGNIAKRGIAVAEPYWLSTRNDLQQGAFIVPFTARYNFEDNLRSTFAVPDGSSFEWDVKEVPLPPDWEEQKICWFEGALFKVRIPSHLRVSLLERLTSMNVRDITLFPDLQGAIKQISTYVPQSR